MESIIAVVGTLPENSKHRTKLTGFLITRMYNTLEHPPISYHGPQFNYRTADGSYNVSLSPVLSPIIDCSWTMSKAVYGSGQQLNIITRMYIFRSLGRQDRRTEGQSEATPNFQASGQTQGCSLIVSRIVLRICERNQVLTFAGQF